MSHAVTEKSGYGAGAGDEPVLTYRDFQSFTANTGPYTTTAIAIGEENGDRLCIALILWGANIALSSVTIGGVSADVKVTVGPSGNASMAIAQAIVPTGTDAQVVATFAGTANRCGIALWTATGLENLDPTDTDGTQNSTNGSKSLTLDIRGGGICIAGGDKIGNTGAVAWTGATQRFNSTIESVDKMTGADFEQGDTDGTVAVSMNFIFGIIAATWR